MNEKTKDFRPLICIDNVGIYPFKDASILLINNAKRTQQTDHNGKTILEIINNLAKTKAKDHQSLSNKAIFKFMDLIEM